MSTFTYQAPEKYIDLITADVSGNTNNYYVFVSKHTEWDDDDVPDTETVNDQASHYNIHKELMHGKKVQETDLSKIIKKITWTANNKYAQYDHRDSTLYAKDFYVVNSSNDVFKCLFNNSNANSTVEPISKANTSFTLADGYTWKYMYSFSSIEGGKFATNTYVPVVANSTVASVAANGSVEVILVENSGENYLAHTSGTVQEVISNTVYRIANTAEASNGYYSTSGFYVSSGTGQTNVISISSYISNSSGRYVTFDSSLVLDLTSEYIISPKVEITGDGTDLTAYSVVDANTNSISGIEIINNGVNYSEANVTIIANTAYGSGAIATAIISPMGGHGSNPSIELGCNRMMAAISVSKGEGNTISTDVSYRQVGLLVNPMANSTTLYEANTFNSLNYLTTNSISGTYLTNEKITGATSNATATIAYANSTVIQTSVINGTFIIGETITGNTSAVTSTLESINTSDIENFFGDVFYYNNISAIQRSSTNSEVLKLIMAF